ncbi:MAG: hypothetical protein LKE39_02055 [Sphaerochaeta sp.]|jgi:hypothetical protein|nr:hypothetical protein [Sphaerochaeta sp.]
MPSNDEKKPAQDAEKKATATNLTKTNATGNTGKQDKTGKTVAFAKPKRKLSIGWWFGIIVLILISISFVLAPAIEAVMGPETRWRFGLRHLWQGKDRIRLWQLLL